MQKKHFATRIAIILVCIFCLPIILLVIYAYIRCPILPTKSIPQTLSLALHSGFDYNKPTITLQHNVDGVLVTTYTLTIENGVRVEEPQEYAFPNLSDGNVEVTIMLGDELNSSFMIAFPTNELYENGLLIYLARYGDEYDIIDGKARYKRYVYFVSGEDSVCYHLGTYSKEWIVIPNPPSPKRFAPNTTPYNYGYNSGWKRNEWVIT